MRSRSVIQLTPLLDVVLLLLFALLTSLAFTDANRKEGEEETAELIAQQNGIIASLTSDNAELSTELSEKEDAAHRLEEKNAAVLEGLSLFLDAHDGELQSLLAATSAKNASNQISAFSSPEKAARSLYLFENLYRKFFMVDVVLRGETNQMWVNGIETSVHIVLDESDRQSEKSINAMKQDIKEVIEEAIRQRQGGAELMMVVLQIGDDAVYHYAWQLIWECLGELEQKYGTEKFYRLNIPWTP